MNAITKSKSESLGFDEYCALATWFHGTAAPGVVIGAFMVDSARALLPEGTLFQALCETRKCLPDAVQLLTPCTTGNGRLKVVDVGRFALALYDKYTGAGARAFLDVNRLERWPDIRDWFLNLRPKASQSGARLLDQVKDAGASIITTEYVTVATAFGAKQKSGPIAICPVCGEAYPVASGDVCLGCSGALPYVPSANVARCGSAGGGH